MHIVLFINNILSNAIKNETLISPESEESLRNDISNGFNHVIQDFDNLNNINNVLDETISRLQSFSRMLPDANSPNNNLISPESEENLRNDIRTGFDHVIEDFENLNNLNNVLDETLERLESFIYMDSNHPELRHRFRRRVSENTESLSENTESPLKNEEKVYNLTSQELNRAFQSENTTSASFTGSALVNNSNIDNNETTTNETYSELTTNSPIFNNTLAIENNFFEQALNMPPWILVTAGAATIASISAVIYYIRKWCSKRSGPYEV